MESLENKNPNRSFIQEHLKGHLPEDIIDLFTIDFTKNYLETGKLPEELFTRLSKDFRIELDAIQGIRQFYLENGRSDKSLAQYKNFLTNSLSEFEHLLKGKKKEDYPSNLPKSPDN